MKTTMTKTRRLPLMISRALLPVLVLAAACEGRGTPEDALSWYGSGTAQDVEEAVAFTDVAYDFPVDTTAGLGGLLDAVFPVSGDGIAYAEGDQFGGGTDCDAQIEDALPWELEAVVTIHPRFYFKTDGCGFDSDEKYYGSFFAEDATGGVFVLGDTKVADFEAGTRVRLRVRGVRTAFDLNMVYAHDVIEVVERDVPVFYTPATGSLGDADVGEVRRVEGVVVTEPDTFGEFQVEADDGTFYSVSLDSELNRRGVSYPLGRRIQATGPVLYSYSLYSLIIMEKGQIILLD